MSFPKLKTILTHKYLRSVLWNFTKEYAQHPLLMSKECHKFTSHWLFGKQEKPPKGLRLEIHSHSHFSNPRCAELSDIVDSLFTKKLSFWSLTDYDSFAAFDALASGRYNLNQKSQPQRKYQLEVNPDKRSITIHSPGHQLVLLRSSECWTDKGDLGIHGYAGEIPNDPPNKRIKFTEAIKRALDGGAFVVLNHPYFWDGLGFHGKKTIEEAVKAGVLALEKNAMEIPPQIYSPVRTALDAKRFNLLLVVSGDAKQLDVYGTNGLVFSPVIYQHHLEKQGYNHADTIKYLISQKSFKTYFNYLKPKQFLSSFAFETH